METTNEGIIDEMPSFANNKRLLEYHSLSKEAAEFIERIGPTMLVTIRNGEKEFISMKPY